MVESNKYNNPCEMTNNPGQQVSPWTEIINGPNGKVVLETARDVVICVAVTACIGLALGYAPTLNVGNASLTFVRT